MRYCMACGAPMETHRPINATERDWLRAIRGRRTARAPRSIRDCPVHLVETRRDRNGRPIPVYRA